MGTSWAASCPSALNRRVSLLQASTSVSWIGKSWKEEAGGLPCCQEEVKSPTAEDAARLAAQQECREEKEHEALRHFAVGVHAGWGRMVTVLR